MSERRRWTVQAVRAALSLVISSWFVAGVAAGAGDDPELAFDPETFKGLTFRSIGPFRGGRVTAVAGVPGDRLTFYFGSTGGGVWQTTDGGVSWRNVSDDGFAAASVGAIAVASSDANVVYAGMGSACVRGNTSAGDGLYRSSDAGKTWKHAGLGEAGQIGRIHVHPTDPDLVYVAVLGHAFGPSDQRGVFRSRDGGKSWERVLWVSDSAGAVDLAMNPRNPRVLFAATWKAERKPWAFFGGGEGSALHRSTDGGDTWEELGKGLPGGARGRIGVAISGADPDRVWALVEAEDGGLFRSDDGGDSFRRVSADRNLRQRAWYYTHVYADPLDAGTVYVLNVALWRSQDGGKSFEPIRAPHGDHHDLWIHPGDPRVLINGNDGGANISYNGGETWSSQANQPTAEMYRVAVDQRFPYRVYGCQQDNTCVSVPSRTGEAGIERHHWYVIGGCESGHVAVDPRDPEITYAGCYGGQIGRHDNRTGQERELMAYPQLAVGQAPRDLKYRFQWNAPVRISPHDPSVLYHTSQYVHRSADEGQHWEVISPDLTRNDREKQDYSGGAITKDNTGTEVYGTVFAFEESPHQRGLLWAGSDDGLVHLSRDGGAAWEEITPREMPEWGQVNSIELSPHGTGRAFLAVTRYKLDDFRPYVFRTDDFGKSWKLLTSGSNGIPASHFVRVVREDPDRKGLLYAGTEYGLYVSFDDGRHWQSFQQKLPVVPVTDLAITQKDLVAATQGRSFWILDDLSPLHELNEAVVGADLHVFQPRDTPRVGAGGSAARRGAMGRNPPSGVMVHYLLSRKLDEKEEVKLEILDTGGAVLRTLSNLKDEPRAPDPFRRFREEPETDRRLPAEKGMNRYVWDFRLPDAEMVEDSVVWGSGRGPRVHPGAYQARLTLGGTSQTRSFEVLADPRIGASAGDLEAQYDLARRVWRSVTLSHGAWKQILEIRLQVDDLVRRLGAGSAGAVEEASKAVREKLAALEARIHQTRVEASQDVLNFPPGLDNQLVALMGVVESADARPTDGASARYAELEAELGGLLGDLDRVLAVELAEFNRVAREKLEDPVIVPAR